MVEMSLLTFVEFTTLYSLSEPIFGDRKPFERLCSRRKTVFFLATCNWWMKWTEIHAKVYPREFVCLIVVFLRQEYPKAKWVFRMIVSGGKRIECICSFVRFDCQIRTRINGRKTFHIAMLSHISLLLCIPYTRSLVVSLCRLLCVLLLRLFGLFGSCSLPAASTYCLRMHRTPCALSFIHENERKKRHTYPIYNTLHRVMFRLRLRKLQY